MAKTKDKDSDAKGDSLDVLEGDRYIRTYSESAHGDEFKALAEEFAGKKPERKVIASDKVTRLQVEYREKSKALDVFVEKSEPFNEDKDGPDFKEAALRFAQSFGGTVFAK